MKKILSKLVIGDVVYKQSVRAPFDEVLKVLEKSIKANDFSISVIHDMKKTFEKVRLPLEDNFQYKIVQLCNAEKAHKVLTTISYDMGIMMPKAITVAQEGDKVVLRFMQMKPWMAGMMFPQVDITPVSRGVMNIMKKIVKQTILELEKV